MFPGSSLCFRTPFFTCINKRPQRRHCSPRLLSVRLAIRSRFYIFGCMVFFSHYVRFMHHWFEIFHLRFSRSQSSNVRGITRSCHNMHPYLEVFMGERGLIWIPNFMEALIFTAQWQIVRKMLNSNPLSIFLPGTCSCYTGNITLHFFYFNHVGFFWPEQTIYFHSPAVQQQHNDLV